MATASKSRLSYFLMACALGLGGVAFMNQTTITKQLNDWRILPRPQRLSELYFTDASRLPRTVVPGAEQKLGFTVHNLEHQTTAYHYKLAAVSDDGGASQPLGDGVITLGHDRSQAVDRTVTMPTATARTAIRVDVEYSGLALDDDTPTTKRQSIQYWVTIGRSPS